MRMRFTLISRGLWKHVINGGEITDTDGDQKALALIGLSVIVEIYTSLVGVYVCIKYCVCRSL